MDCKNSLKDSRSGTEIKFLLKIWPSLSMECYKEVKKLVRKKLKVNTTLE